VSTVMSSTFMDVSSDFNLSILTFYHVVEYNTRSKNRRRKGKWGNGYYFRGMKVLNLNEMELKIVEIEARMDMVENLKR
jgi:hypothetical protein